MEILNWLKIALGCRNGCECEVGILMKVVTSVALSLLLGFFLCVVIPQEG